MVEDILALLIKLRQKRTSIIIFIEDFDGFRDMDYFNETLKSLYLDNEEIKDD